MSYLWQSSPQRKMVRRLWRHTKRSLLGCLAHVPWCYAIAVIPISVHYACLQHQRHEKWPCQKTWCLSESWGLCQFGQAYHRQNCVAMGCPLVSAPAVAAPFMHRDTTAFRKSYAQLLVASAVPVKPDKFTLLDFSWTPYGCSLPSNQTHVSLFLALSRWS
jgi:hypothetical protein